MPEQVRRQEEEVVAGDRRLVLPRGEVAKLHMVEVQGCSRKELE